MVAQRQYATAGALRTALEIFVFDVGEPSLELNQAPDGGSRFPVDARLDGRTFVKFHVDLGVGDDVIEPLDRIVGEDWEKPFMALAAECGMVHTLTSAYEKVAAYWRSQADMT